MAAVEDVLADLVHDHIAIGVGDGDEHGVLALAGQLGILQVDARTEAGGGLVAADVVRGEGVDLLEGVVAAVLELDVGLHRKLVEAGRGAAIVLLVGHVAVAVLNDDPVVHAGHDLVGQTSGGGDVLLAQLAANGHVHIVGEGVAVLLQGVDLVGGSAGVVAPGDAQRAILGLVDAVDGDGGGHGLRRGAGGAGGGGVGSGSALTGSGLAGAAVGAEVVGAAQVFAAVDAVIRGQGNGCAKHQAKRESEGNDLFHVCITLLSSILPCCIPNSQGLPTELEEALGIFMLRRPSCPRCTCAGRR